MVRPIPDIDWYDGAASGQQRSALMRLQPSRVMISYATVHNKPWDNSFQTREDYTLFVDSGGYHQMKTGQGEYGDDAEAYLDYIDQHKPAHWALRDFPCEPSLLADLDRTVEQHQQLTTDHHAKLLNTAADRGLEDSAVAVLQGWDPEDYIEHIDRLQDRGCLTDYVGIGSVCRRNATEEIINVILRIRDALPSRVDLHAFGVKNSVLQYEEVVDALQSADSSAYDFAASQKGERMCDSFSYRDSLWAWLCWRRKLFRQVGSESLSDIAGSDVTDYSGAGSLRDCVWSTALELLRTAQSSITVSDILEQSELAERQRRTVRKTLRSMASSGWLTHESGSMYWQPGPKAIAELQN